jgi:transposase
MPALRAELRGAIVGLTKAGWHPSQIAEELGINIRTAARWVARFREGGKAEPRPSSGRPAALSPSLAKKAMKMLKSGEYAGANEVARALHSQGLTSKQLHKATIIRHARAAATLVGKVLKVSRARPPQGLGAATIQKRLGFAKTHLHTDFTRFMFTQVQILPAVPWQQSPGGHMVQ